MAHKDIAFKLSWKERENVKAQVKFFWVYSHEQIQVRSQIWTLTNKCLKSLAAFSFLETFQECQIKIIIDEENINLVAN